MKTAEIEVTLIDHMGSDLSVCNAARVSFAKESAWEETQEVVFLTDFIAETRFSQHLSEPDTKLIAYLAKHNHWSPFAHCFASFRIKAPIFCARQLVKHQVGLAWNEESRRYIDEEPEFFFPKVWRGRPEGSIKQGSSGVVQHMLHAQDVATSCTTKALAEYNELLSIGVAPEQARMVLPQNTMTNWIWSGSLMAFARVCNLRLDPHAQAETREVAVEIDSRMNALFPVSWNALTK